MTTYCWEHMTHVPVKDYNYNGQMMQVRDETSFEQVESLVYVKVGQNFDSKIDF